jgi:Glycosyl transferases group 1
MWVQDLWPESLSATGYVRSPFILNRVAEIVKWIYQRCDLVLVQSPSFVERVSKMSEGVPVVYYPNPGDVGSETGRQSPVKVVLPKGFNVTFGGNLGTVQSVETIIDAAEHLSGVTGLNIVMLGSGSRLDWIKQELERRSLTNVFLLGRVEPEVATDAMGRSDALLVSLKDMEILNKTIPSKLSTYLGCGRPIIASMNGEGAENPREKARVQLAT